MLCAPGDSLFTVSNPTSYDATFRFNKIHDGLGFYDRQSAVSAAAPIVTGVIALVLQENPALDRRRGENDPASECAGGQFHRECS